MKKYFVDMVSFDALENRCLLSTVKIMPLGDSVTQGYGGQQSYRLALYNDLAQAGYSVDFVGSQTGTNDGVPTYNNLDENNEGHSGFTADQLTPNVQGWAATYKPDVVLLHIGTNDIIHGQDNPSTISDITSIISNLRASVSNVKILLAKIIPTTAANGSQVPDLDSRIGTLATSLSTSTSPITVVDQYTGFDDAADTIDGIHPNATGEALVAQKWFTALQAILPAPTTPPPGTYLADLTPTSQTNGSGNYEQDRSNGGTGAIDGGTLTLNGTTYMRGLGVAAASTLTYDLTGKGYTQFNSDIGVDDEIASGGGIKFQVYADNVLKYDSGTMTATTATKSISVDITGATTLKLVVADAGGGSASVDHGDWANARVYAAPVTAPAAPSVLTATAGSSSITLGWTDSSSNETGFRVERKTAGGSYAQLASLAANVTTYTDTTAVAGTAYSYHVYAYNGGGNSGYSNEATATISSVATGSAYLSDLNYVVNNNGWGPPEKDRSNGEQGASDGKTITLNGTTFAKGLGVHASSDITYNLAGNYSSFTATVGVDDEVGSRGSVAFQVYVDGAKKYDSGKLTGVSASGTVNVSLSGGKTLELVVTDSGDGNDSDHADWANAYLTASVAAAPAAPSGATASNVSTGVMLGWIDNSSNETGFEVQRMTAGGTWANLAAVGANVTSYTDTTVAAGTTYSYRVYSYNSVGNSTTSNEPAVTTPAAPTPPAAPTLATAGNVASGVLVGWSDNSTDETGFEIQRSTAGGSWTNLASVAANAISYTDTTVTASTTYSYRVYSFNAAGNSTTSNEPSVTTPAPTAPNSPSNAAANYGSGAVTVTWADNSANETSFRVERKTGSAGTYVSLGTPAANATTFSDTTAQLATTYYYRVFAVNAAGDSTASDEASLTTPTAVTTTSYLSDLPYTVVSNGWGPVEKDKSNGESAAGDGKALTLNGATYAKGLGVHAASEVDYNLGGNYTSFTAAVGVDDEVGSGGSVIFQVYVDGVKAFDSGKMTGVSATQAINVDVTGKSTLRLVVTDAGDGNAYDHADWANAQLTSGPIVAPNAPTLSWAVFSSSSNKVALAWADNSTNETGFRVQRKIGSGGTYADIATLAANTTSYTDAGPFTVSTTYFYRIIASNSAGDSTPSTEMSITTPASTRTFVSDLTPVSSTNGWGPVEKDQSNGESGAGDGKTISIRGATYAKGLGVHGYSKVVYNLAGGYSTFTSDLGIDDETGGGGSVTFMLYADGVLKYSSGTVKGTDAIKTASISVAGVQQLWLVVDNANDGADFDHADWAGAQLAT